MNSIEDGTRLSLDFGKLTGLVERGQRVVPVVLQDADSKEVLFVAYANEESLRETLETRRAVLWSTSRDELWRKGDGSGDVLDLVDVRVNCEQTSLVYRVRPRTGGVCHTRDETGRARPHCFYRRLEDATTLKFL